MAKTFKEYSALYFTKTKKILEKCASDQNFSCLQFTQFADEVMVSGIEEVINVLKRAKVWNKIQFFSCSDGDILKKGEAAIQIVGKYSDIALYEGIIDGILTRMSSISTNCYELLKIVSPEKIIFMGDRQDLYLAQEYDGYAAYIAGIKTFVTNAHIKKIPKSTEIKVVGTIPHALIQQFHGNLNDTLEAYSKTFPSDKLVALLDYNNDCVDELKNLKPEIKNKLYAVRLDTSKNILDKSLLDRQENYGVSIALIKLIRKTLNEMELNKVKIVISSNINKEMVKLIEEDNGVWVDYYGIGSSLMKIQHQFTGDLVEINNRENAKFGRKKANNKLLRR